MGNITNIFKEKMASEFSKEDAFTNEVGREVYQGFKSEIPENEFSEEWSEKYKKSIDCSNPKGFSQRAHCQGRKKKEAKEARELKQKIRMQNEYKTSSYQVINPEKLKGMSKKQLRNIKKTQRKCFGFT